MAYRREDDIDDARLFDLLFEIFGCDSIECYDADDKNELRIVKTWHEKVKTPLGSMKELESEAKKAGGVMQTYLERAKAKYKKGCSVSGLTEVDCVVVLMYTDDNGGRAFFRQFNAASYKGEFGPYLVYTSLLLSTLRKLARNKPLPKDTPLYRGLRSQYAAPDGHRIFWKTFTSTSTSYEVAQRPEFSGPNGMILEFRTSAQNYAAKLGKLSAFGEHEVILLPFEAFDVVEDENDECHFRTSKVQNILGK